MKRARSKMRPLRWISFLLILVIWEGAAYYVKLKFERPNLVLPSIEYTLSEIKGFASFWGEGMVVDAPVVSYKLALLVLGKHSLITIARVLGGTCAGVALGIGVGLLFSWLRTVRQIFLPPIEIVRQIPLLALSAVFILWFGGKEIGNYLYVTYGVFVMLIVNTLNAVNNIPAVYHQFAMTLGATRRQVFRTVVIPAIIPELRGGLRVAIGLSWAIVLAAEYLAAKGGLGRMMLVSEYFLFTGRMIVVAILFVIYANITDIIMVFSLNRILKWAPKI